MISVHWFLPRNKYRFQTILLYIYKVSDFYNNNDNNNDNDNNISNNNRLPFLLIYIVPMFPHHSVPKVLISFFSASFNGGSV